MDEYISREAVFQVVHGIARGIADRDTEALKAKDMKAFYMAKGAKGILDSVDTDLCYIPAADVQPVKRGKWLGYVCSECHVCADYFVSGDVYFDMKPDFCPFCGARMDGDTE